jgi:ATP-binding cassette subfamily F protein uup
MNILDVSQLSKSFGMKQVLKAVSFTIDETEKVGFIGANGSGKTTLFRLISGMESADSGELSWRRGSSAGYLPQDPVLDEGKTVAGEIESALGEIRGKLDRYHAVGQGLASATPAESDRLLREQADLGQWLDHHQAWQTDHRIDEVLLKLDIPDRNAPIALLSGGMKKRVALAKLILQMPDLLLLDEPTNHLDTETILWLEGFLTTYPGAVLLITHDRYFLDRVARRILELEEGTLYAYSGGYTDYLEGRAERLMHEGREQATLMNLLRRESEWMRRGPKARRTKSKARIDRFYEMQDQRKDRDDRRIALHLESDQRLGNTILELIYLNKSFGDRTLVRDLSLILKAGDRIGIIGPNGSGKTTLLRMILGEEYPTTGRIVRGKNTKIAYFDQKRECLDPDIRVEDAVGEGFWVTIGGARRHKTGYLGDFLFEYQDFKRVVRSLSGGEKARLILAKMMLENANLLILDEPTNDLDIPTLQLFDDALIEYNGCVLMVSHDRFFLDKIATGILSFEGDGVVRYTEGNYQDYQERLRREQEAGRALSDGAGVTTDSPQARSRVAKRGLSFKENRELETLELDISRMETRKTELETVLANPSHHAGEVAEIRAWSDEFVTLEKTLEAKIARWEELETKRGE